MKKHILRAFLAAFGATAIILSFTGRTKAKTDIYPTTFEVYALDRKHDIIILQDYNGEIFTWKGIEDWCLGDVASALMNDNGTETITDDEILMLRYSGYNY